jgi:hypothetical protein
MFSDCSGECCVCANGWNYRTESCACLSRHGDDDFSPAGREYVVERLKNNRYPDSRETMLAYIGMTEEQFQNEYMNESPKSDPEYEELRKVPYKQEPFKKVPVTITKTVFNPEFWIIGDLYYVSACDESDPKIYFLHSKSDDAVTLIKEDGVLRKAKLSSFLDGENKILAHVTPEEIVEYVCRFD